MVEQGDLISIEGIGYPAVVISKNAYNETNHVIACPITEVSCTTLGYYVELNKVRGYVQCDNMKMLDLSKRGYQKRGSVSMADMINILSRVNALFEIY